MALATELAEDESVFITSCSRSSSSINESHAPQLVHFPIHFGVVMPQC